MSDLPFRTEWRPVSPTAENSKTGIRRAFVVVVACVAVGFLAPVGFWTLASILLGFAALLSIGFDLRRLHTGLLLLERIQFDDRRIERVTRHEPTGKERRRVVAFDALERADIRKGTLGLYEVGSEWPKEVFGLDEFPDEAMVRELLGLLQGKGVPIESDSTELVPPNRSRRTR